MSVFQAGSPSVSLSPRWGPLCPCDFPPHCDSTWAWVYGAWGVLWECRQSKQEGGFYQAGSACLTTSPHHGGPGQGDEPQVTKLGTCPICCVSFGFSVPRGSPRGGPGGGCRAGLQEVAAPGPPEPEAAGPAGRPSGPAAVASPRGSGGHAVLTRSPWPGCKRPAWGWSRMRDVLGPGTSP